MCSRPPFPRRIRGDAFRTARAMGRKELLFGRSFRDRNDGQDPPCFPRQGERAAHRGECDLIHGGNIFIRSILRGPSARTARTHAHHLDATGSAAQHPLSSGIPAGDHESSHSHGLSRKSTPPCRSRKTALADGHVLYRAQERQRPQLQSTRAYDRVSGTAQSGHRRGARGRNHCA